MSELDYMGLLLQVFLAVTVLNTLLVLSILLGLFCLGGLLYMLVPMKKCPLYYIKQMTMFLERLGK